MIILPSICKTLNTVLGAGFSDNLALVTKSENDCVVLKA